MDFKVKQFYNFLMLISFIFNVVHGEDIQYCSLYYDKNGREVSSIEWRDGILLPPIPDTIKQYESQITMKTVGLEIKLGGISVNGKNDIDNMYVNIISGLNKFTIQPWDLAKYEEYETEQNMTIQIAFNSINCKTKGPSKITFIQPIIDTNNHDPVFLKTSYEYNLTMPLLKGFELSPHDPIIVKDIDLSNDNIAFELKNQPHGFSISLVGKDPANPKNYLAKFEVTDTVYLTDDISFMLQATDSGNPPRTTNTTINIKVDLANSLPRFSHSLYSTDQSIFYNRMKPRVPLKFAPGDIKLTHGYTGNHTFEIDGIAENYKKHFEISETNEKCGIGKCIKIDLVDLPEHFWDHQEDFFIILKAKKDSFEATTVLYIRMPTSSKAVEVSDKPIDITNKTIGTGLTFLAIFCFCYVAYMFLIKTHSYSYDVKKTNQVPNSTPY